VHSDDECDVAYSVSASAVSILQKLVQADMEFGYVKPGHGTKGRQECFFFSDKDCEDIYKEHIVKTEIHVLGVWTTRTRGTANLEEEKASVTRYR